MGREYWDSRARNYGRAGVGYSDGGQFEYEDRLRWAAFRRICPVRSGMRVLDLGCGVGRWSVRLANLGCQVVGTDISPLFVEMAQPHPMVEYKVMTAQNLDLPAQSFDLALSVTVLQHVMDDGDLQRSIANLARVLKRGGRMMLLEYSPLRVPRLEAKVDYMCYRSHGEWMRLFEHEGFRLMRDTGVRFVGYNRFRGKVNWLSRRIDLSLGRVPWLTSRSDVHAMVFSRP